MRFFKLFGVALVALCACAAMMAASAFALPTVLLGGEEKAGTYTGKSVGVTDLETPTTSVECSSASGEGTTEATTPLGQFHIRFAGCKDLVACTGTGETSGVILSLGSFHLVYDTLKTSLSEAGVAILFLPGTTKFNCSGFAEVEVKSGGMVLCLITNPTVLTKVFTFGCKKIAKGKPEESKYYNDGGTLISISPLLTVVGTAAATESDQVGTGTDEYKEDVLIMI